MTAQIRHEPFAAAMKVWPDDTTEYERAIARGRRLRSEAFHQALGGLARLARRAIVDGVVEPLARQRRARAAYRELSALNDRMLADIGLSRGDILAVANGTWEDPREHRRELELVVDNPRQAESLPAQGIDAERTAA